MKFKIENKNIDLPKSLQSDDIGYALFCSLIILLIPSAILSIITCLISSFIFGDTNIDLNLTLSLSVLMFLLICGPPIIAYLFRHKFYLSIYGTQTMDERLQFYLNKVYVDKNDNEKVYLLHELIKKYGVEYSHDDQSHDNYIILKLNTDKYQKIDYDDYTKDQIDGLKKVINHKKIESNETFYFFDQYIDEYISPKITTAEESLKTTQRIIDKNL